MQRLIPFLIFLSSVISVLACSPGMKNEPVKYTNPRADECRSDPGNRYHFSLPEGKQQKLPLVVVLDPHGNGLLGVKKVIPALHDAPCFIVGSDVIRNNYPAFIHSLTTLIDDITARYPVDRDKLFLVGFSGGARMAFEFARHNPVNGIIMCGAGPNNANLPCPVYMISGTTDFNFPETWSDPLNTSGSEIYFSDYFRGSHEWPPASNLRDGLLFMLYRQNSLSDQVVNFQVERLINSADSLFNKQDFIFALKAVQKASLLKPGYRKAIQLQKTIKEAPGCSIDIGSIQKYLSLESKITQEYAKATIQKDSLWWFNEIDVLNNRIAGSDGNEKDHLQRIKGFLGIIYYSQAVNFINTHPDHPQIANILTAHRKLEPNNPDVYYHYALYFHRNRQIVKSHFYLELAKKAGFTDLSRLKRDFPAEAQ